MYTYVLFQNNKRVNLREDDLTSDKISRIFQVGSLEANVVLPLSEERRLKFEAR